MWAVYGGIYTDTKFETLEPGTEEHHGPYPTYKEAYDKWNERTRWLLDVCCHRVRIREVER